MTPEEQAAFTDLPRAALEVIERVCTRFETAWQAGQTPHLQDYWAGEPAAAGPLLFQELLYLELEYRRRRGEAPAANDYLARFPTQADLIRQVWLAAQAAEQPPDQRYCRRGDRDLRRFDADVERGECQQVDASARELGQRASKAEAMHQAKRECQLPAMRGRAARDVQQRRDHHRQRNSHFDRLRRQPYVTGCRKGQRQGMRKRESSYNREGTFQHVPQ